MERKSDNEIRRTTIKIFSVSFEKGTVDEAPGTVIVDNSSMKVVCRNGVLNLLQLQPSGKPRMTIREFLNGLKLRGTLRFE